VHFGGIASKKFNLHCASTRLYVSVSLADDHRMSIDLVSARLNVQDQARQPYTHLQGIQMTQLYVNVTYINTVSIVTENKDKFNTMRSLLSRTRSRERQHGTTLSF